MPIHVVKRGDTLSAIAKKYRIKSWQELYQHPSNAAFRQKRPNPNLIYPGDQINIPSAGASPTTSKGSSSTPAVNLTHRVRLHFRSLSLTDASFESHLKSAQLVYAQYGIKIDFGSGQSLHLTPEQAKKFAVVDGQCKWTINAGEMAEIHKLGGAPSGGILVFYVNKLASGNLGCGGHAALKPACIVAAGASKWDTAHEVGHVLLTSSFSPVHSTDINNLMHKSASSYAKTPILTTAQVDQIKKSPYCVRIS